MIRVIMVFVNCNLYSGRQRKLYILVWRQTVIYFVTSEGENDSEQLTLYKIDLPETLPI